jgi:hypothetical protein
VWPKLAQKGLVSAVLVLAHSSKFEKLCILVTASEMYMSNFVHLISKSSDSHV